MLNRAKEILSEMGADGLDFTFPRFKSLWFKVRPKGTEFNNLFREYHDAIRDEQPKTASQYCLAISSMHKFHNRFNEKGETVRLRYADVTVDFLKDYERWMLAGADDKGPEKRPRSKTTIGMYCRCAKAIFNQALVCGLIEKDVYPFGKGKYVIPTGKNVKKALSAEEIGKLATYSSEVEAVQRARDMFMLSFYCNGANFKDLCKLRCRLPLKAASS
ncbi:MAG TPA: phage integrase SAM-like domain-containing protein [Dinghuibacter sp.]|uniref:phage integrase SAM-like domain-containing protein n=1 Tax=Dinghuibacter sp. TaxID=2024697 RepID=UPI002CA0CA7F|nr:phage integrase SAM-like domain-containing protein [Dinghuibacter sp.]HTJ11437.1 phage integrase SAM-like domain-containing protein [Dinghuibacter sp.]